MCIVVLPLNTPTPRTNSYTTEWLYHSFQRKCMRLASKDNAYAASLYLQPSGNFVDSTMPNDCCFRFIKPSVALEPICLQLVKLCVQLYAQLQLHAVINHTIVYTVQGHMQLQSLYNSLTCYHNILVAGKQSMFMIDTSMLTPQLIVFGERLHIYVTPIVMYAWFQPRQPLVHV